MIIHKYLLLLCIVCSSAYTIALGNSCARIRQYTITNLPADSVLRVGMQAPPLKVNNWRNGRVVEKFEKGRYYVVEFTSILCGPCKKAVPRLERLQKKFGDSATIIGVYGDKDIHLKYVDSMIKKMKLSYSIAAADPFPYPVSKTWLKGDSTIEKNLIAGNYRPFCTSFVIDKQGKLVWIGNALDEPFERIVEAIFNGTYHADIYTDYLKNKDQLIQEYMQVSNNVETHPEQVPPMIKKLDSMILKDPEEGNYKSFKANLLMKADEKAAFAYIRELMNTTYKEKGSDNLQMVLSYILTGLANQYKPYPPYPDMRTLKTNDYELLIDLAKHNLAISDERYETMNLSIEALGYFLKGEKKKAIDLQEKVIKLKKMKGNDQVEEDERALLYYRRK